MRVTHEHEISRTVPSDYRRLKPASPTPMMMSSSEPSEDEPLDPRIQNELDMMNRSAVLINKFENDLVLEKKRFQILYQDSSEKLNALFSRLGTCIQKAMPYYDCRLKAKDAQELLQAAATDYERAVSEENAAREMFDLAEQDYDAEKAKCNAAWGEMLNHATIKMLETESKSLTCKTALEEAENFLQKSQSDVRRQYKLNKRAIAKSKSYYELKSKLHQTLEQQKKTITKKEHDFSTAKSLYARSMSNLEVISEEIHNRRKRITDSNGNMSNIEFTLGDSDTGMSEDSDSLNGLPQSSSLTVPTYRRTDFSLSPAGPSVPNHSSIDMEIMDDDSDKRSTSLISTPKRRCASCKNFSTSSPYPLTKTRSMSAPAKPDGSAADFIDGCLDADSELNRSDSSILDDQCIDGATSHKYFDTNSFEQPIEVASICSRSISRDYETLPTKLSAYQKQFTLKRRCSMHVPNEKVAASELETMLHLLDNDLYVHKVSENTEL